MALSDRFTGRDLTVRFTPDLGVITTISGDFTSYSEDVKFDQVDVTAGNERARAHLHTIESVDFSMDAYFATEVLFNIMKAGAQGVLTVYPKGIGTGKPVHSFYALIASSTITSPHDGAVELAISGMRSGAMILDYGSVQA